MELILNGNFQEREDSLPPHSSVLFEPQHHGIPRTGPCPHPQSAKDSDSDSHRAGGGELYALWQL
jgi:hypothetical protein